MKKVVQQLNQVQADAHSLFIAFHNYHWLVRGTQFYLTHKYTEEAYEEMGELFDDMAERAVQIGGKVVSKPEELIKLAKVPVTFKESYTVKEVFDDVKKAYEYLVIEFKKLEKIAEEVNDTTTSNLAQDHYGKYEKKIWMLNATLG